jgi:hypothetical protein
MMKPNDLTCPKLYMGDRTGIRYQIVEWSDKHYNDGEKYYTAMYEHVSKRFWRKPKAYWWVVSHVYYKCGEYRIQEPLKFTSIEYAKDALKDKFNLPHPSATFVDGGTL